MDWIGNEADITQGPEKPGQPSIFRLAPKAHRVSAGLMGVSPHLIVELKSFHVHTQELGIYFKLSRLISRGDVKDHISETIKNRIPNRDPLPVTRVTPHSSTPCCSTQAVLRATQSQASLVSLPLSLFLLPISLLLSTPQPFSLAGPETLFSLPGCFPSILCLGASSAALDHAHCLLSLSLSSCLPRHPDSSFRAGATLLLLSHPVPSPETPLRLPG